MSAMKDIQQSRDQRGIDIDKVGVKGIRYPITVQDKVRGEQQTVALVNMYVNLPHEFRGTHMSRFVEILNEHRGSVNVNSLPKILTEIKKRLNAEAAHMEVCFPYFIEKKAPVSGAVSLMEYQCKINGAATDGVDISIEVSVPVTSVCPRSKELAERGAHNQRAIVDVAIRFTGMIWLEDLIAMVEEASSCEIYSLLKRPDEKYVTERAFERPLYVDDLARAVAARMHEHPDITWYSVDVETQESVHNHNFYAHIEVSKN